MITKLPLSESTDGRGIPITSTSSGSPNDIHTAVSGTSSLDEIWLYATNWGSIAASSIKFFFGGTSDSDSIIVHIPPEGGVVLVVPGFLLNNGCVVQAYLYDGSATNIHGFVNRIS